METPLPFRTVLFDLDGTLADTAPDLAHALNRLRQEEGLQALPFEVIRPTVSNGAAAILRAGFGLATTDPTFGPLKKRFLRFYQDHLAEETRLFSGMDALLDALEVRNMNWGIVTNKPSRFTNPLMEGLGLAERAACIVSGDTTPNRKPDPEPLLLGCTQAGSQACQCLYVGDAVRDIEAGRRAGMATLVALFGYIQEDARPEDWGADSLVRHPLEILDWIEANGR